MTAPALVLLGPPGHGVTRYAHDVARAVRAQDGSVVVVPARDVARAPEVVREHPRVHLHVTDRLVGRSPEEAAENLEQLASLTRLTITVHDLPQTSDGTPMARRVAAYHRFFAVAEGVVVNSRHEAELVREFLPDARTPAVITLGAAVERTPDHEDHDAAPHVRRDLVVLIAGFVYPGKGHGSAISAARSAVDVLRSQGEHVGNAVVRAIGAPSAGHEADVEDLRLQAEAVEVSFEVTGFLDDRSFADRMLDEGTPLAAHEHMSASRSMLDWVEAGRRPLVVRSRYAAEMARLRPGTMTVYHPDRLADRLADSWRRPRRTWLTSGTSLTPSLDDIAREYLSWWTTPVLG